MSDLRKEIERRRTFAIISHPDAGKTTLTEKLLLYGGAIRMAGSVKARKTAKHAVSDWMEIEKQRGISVTSSVMQFNYQGNCINILDTPGHQDFSEDTYRTLMAADNAVMVLDGAKGVEAQTRKLFHVCSIREIPIFTFVNKMDRETKDAFELMDELENELGIKSYPMNWPIGCGLNFKGMYDREKKVVKVFKGGNHGQSKAEVSEMYLEDEATKEFIGEDLYNKLIEDIELLDMAGEDFNMEKVKNGSLTPVFFGSAITNFGVQTFLEEFLNITTPPLSRMSDVGEIDAFDKEFSAFVFKIQANMNKAHRDRIAFMRICSGKFEKGMEVYHVQGKNKIKLSQPQQFLAQEREIVQEAYAGDIIGVFDPGIFRIGDTLCEASKKFEFEGIPIFAPEHFARVRPVDTMKRKQFVKGITQISQEGAIQVFREPHIGAEELIVGVVGVLQFEVLEYRLKNEYNVDIKLERLPFRNIRWIEECNGEVAGLSVTSDTKIVEDLKGRSLLLFQTDWGISWALEHNKGLVLSAIAKSE
ncbi:peptide chain release factor 3 [Clostridium sp. KNHs214]|uniref:peptide chain release factor 3 n=1 Tax=Clostridium sp. KNHs214 TaxID=1540257 RepID=UPI00054FBE70|nr:peptide chain release factor 3 [Clostridium sp. KNHs214]